MIALSRVLLWLLQCCDSLSCNNAAVQENSADLRIQTVLAYINKNLTEELHVDEIARYCHLSKYHLCRLFRENTGLTIMQYVLEQRLAVAKTALQQTDIPVSIVSTQAGFLTFSYFCHVFRAKEGISPSQFRKLHRQDI